MNGPYIYYIFFVLQAPQPGVMTCSCEQAEDIIAKCEECEEYMCIMCIRAHSKFKLTKSHTVTLLKATTSTAPKPKLKKRSVKIGVRPHTRNKSVQCNRKPSLTPVTQRALSSDKKCKKFHGINLGLFNQIYDGIQGKFVKSHKLAPKDQLSVFYHKLKANCDNTELSTIYGVEERLISKVFKNLVDVLFDFSRDFIGWLSKADNQRTMPKSFKKHFPKTRAILDATEIRTQIPKSVRSAVLKYSSYKNYHSLKILIVIAPCGLIQFISKAYGGRTTDSQITGMHILFQFSHFSKNRLLRNSNFEILSG